jgi:hypothetical protein
MENNDKIRTLDTQLLRIKKALEYLYRGKHCDDLAVNTITDEVQALYLLSCPGLKHADPMSIEDQAKEAGKRG